VSKSLMPNAALNKTRERCHIKTSEAPNKDKSARLTQVTQRSNDINKWSRQINTWLSKETIWIV